MKISSITRAAALVAGLGLATGIAHAESFSKLSGQGYAVGKLTRGKSGSYGWVLSGNGKHYFCRINVALAYVNRKEMVGITSSGRLIKMDRATYEASIGGPDPSIPQWSNLQVGRPRPADVGACAPLR